MASRAIAVPPTIQPIVIGHFILTAEGMEVSEVRGRPAFEEYQGVGDFIQRAHHASGFWLGDWLRYGESRADWRDRISQAHDATGLSLKTLKNVRAVAGSIERTRRRPRLEFALHSEVAGLTPDEQVLWLSKAEVEGWSQRELRLEIRASRRRRIIDGQAVLEGMYRVIYADFPWRYSNRPPSGSGAGEHYRGMTVEEGCRLPVQAHALPNSVLFFWVTAPMLYYATDPSQGPDAYRLIRAWGFTPKTGAVWDKVDHVFGNYFSIRHEHLIVATRGKNVTPDHPTPQVDSVQTIRRGDDPHSAKPREFRQIIERMYDGPYLELFGRELVPGWTVFGDDARLWGADAERASA